MDDVIVVRRSDGAEFRILWQARSPDGPLMLQRVAAPYEQMQIRGAEFVRDFTDPRKGVPMCSQCRADKVQHPALGQHFVCLVCDGKPDPRALDVSGIPSADDYERKSADAVRERARSDAERILAAVKQHLDGARKHPFDPVGRGGNLSDGGVAMANKALAPLGWRVTFPMTNEGPLDSTRRWCLERVS